MEKKVKKKIIRIIILLVVIFLMYNIFTGGKNKEIKVSDYMPDKPMVKIFDGGFEDSGEVEIIDLIKGEYYQKKIIVPGSTGVAVYRVNEEGYRLVYRDEKAKKLDDNYIDKKANEDLILLRSPIKKGVSWINDDKSTYKILSVDEKLKIRDREIDTIKLRYRKGEQEYYIYFAKGLGVVEIESEMGTSKLVEVSYKVDEYLEKLTITN